MDTIRSDGVTDGPSVVLDPFAGVGTILVEADFEGTHTAIGFEINPYAAFTSQTKLKAHTGINRLERKTVSKTQEN